MMELLEMVGPAIWRASWQGAVLALVVVGLVRCCGERLSPRWRFLLWGVVVLRLLVVVTPASPWSVFNLTRWNRQTEPAIVEPVVSTLAESAPLVSKVPSPIITPESDVVPVAEASHPPVVLDAIPKKTPVTVAPDLPIKVRLPERVQGTEMVSGQLIAAAWLVGCVGMLVKLLVSARALRRRLSVCRTIDDATLVQLLEGCRRALGLKRLPRFLVTPDSLGPCLIGTWRPSIVLPESVVTEASAERLRHVLAHEVAHLVRGDLWTNWLLLAVRVLHWFNPLAWWTIREMQAERESACDELAFAALGDVDRDAYAATIVELATGLTPSPLAPGLIGLFSSPFRLKTRIERLLRTTLVTRVRTPVCVAAWVVLVFFGMTDAMPDAKGEPPRSPDIAPEARTHISDARMANTPPHTIAPFTEAVAREHQQAWAAYLESDMEITNSIGMKLRLIPPGEFVMGSPETDPDHGKNEEQHPARVTSPFYLGKYEVTHREWKTMMGTEPWSGKNQVREGDGFPANYVSWEDAVEFCRKLSLKEKVTYRLPSETEWEYACRAGTKTAYSFGDKAADLHAYAWFDQNAGKLKKSERFARAVGQKRANPFGLHDLHGSLWELCRDEYEFHYSKRQLPSVTPKSGADLVVRGGCWADPSESSRSAFRFCVGPKDKNLFVGFRVIREVPETAKAGAAKANPEGAKLWGRCIDIADNQPMGGVSVRLYRCDGRTAAPVEIARTVSRFDGSFTFEGLAKERMWQQLDGFIYGCIGVTENGLVGETVVNAVTAGATKDIHWHPEIRMSNVSTSLVGRVVNDKGAPVAGATIYPYAVHYRPVAELGSVTTDSDGRFKLEKLATKTLREDQQLITWCHVRHPDYPDALGQSKSLQQQLVITLPSGCVVTSTVTDSVTGKPASGATITAWRFKTGSKFTTTNGEGRFRFVLEAGHYDFHVEAPDRVCVAVTNRVCKAGGKIELPPFRLINGGFITGQIVVEETGKPIAVASHGEPILVGLFGPSQPPSDWMRSITLAAVDASGKFRMRAAPGANFPYIVNERSTRSTATTLNQPAVVVKEGETTTCQMQTLQQVPFDEARYARDTLERTRKLIADLPKDPVERTKRIIAEVRKTSYANGQTERWCSFIRELVTIGPAAVPLLCEELDHSDRAEQELRASGKATADEIRVARRFKENSMLRFCGFTLRAIGDPRAVPALIRAIPRTLIDAGSDCGMTVHDKELMTFMQAHDLDEHDQKWFGYGRPVREIGGAIQKLTGQSFDHLELNWIWLSEDPRRLALQRLAFQRQAQRCQEWWEANAPKLTNDPAYHKVNLRLSNEPLPGKDPPPIRKQARTRNSSNGLVVSPADQTGPYLSHFYDLDTMLNRVWPSHLSKDPASFDKKPFAYWAAQSDLDLMCVRHRSADGKETCVLRSLGMQVHEISSAEFGRLDESLAAGKLPEGRPINGDLLIHFDEKTQQPAPGTSGTFLYVTREGNRGVIQTTPGRNGVTLGLWEIQP